MNSIKTKPNSRKQNQK